MEVNAEKHAHSKTPIVSSIKLFAGLIRLLIRLFCGIV